MTSHIPVWVENYVGIPFAEKGYDRRGCNCWGLVRLGLHEQHGVVGLPTYEETHDDTRDRDNIPRVYDAEAAKDWIRIDAGCERPGDVVLMRIGAVPMHVGLVVARGWMLHVCDGIDSTCERYDGLEWRSRIIGFFRHKGI